MPSSKFKMGHSTNVSHGHSFRGKISPEYRCWNDIKQRCLNPRNRFFKYYGGRDVSICGKWRGSFDAFLADVGPRPTPKHTIDRFPDRDGDYEPGNVRWATRQEQIDNRDVTKKLSLGGEVVTISEACRRLGLGLKMVRTRIERGWPTERALSPANWTRPDLKRRSE